MKKLVVAVGAVLLIGAIAGLLVPLWTMTAGMGMSGHGYTAIVLMLLFCFGIGGGLMFLIFYSARRGHDEAVHFGTAGAPQAGPGGANRSSSRREPAPPQTGV